MRRGALRTSQCAYFLLRKQEKNGNEFALCSTPLDTIMETQATLSLERNLPVGTAAAATVRFTSLSSTTVRLLLE
jgi:hypothetical protein